MADEGIFPLLLIAGAGYLLWKYTGTPSAASTPAASTPAASPETTSGAGVHRAGAAQPIYTPTYTPPAAQQMTRSSYFTDSYVPAAQTTSQQPAPSQNPYWNPTGGAAPATSGNDPIPDLTGYYRPPGNIDTGPTIQPTPQAVMTPDQIAYNQRCTYITGAPIPGCV